MDVVKKNFPKSNTRHVWSRISACDNVLGFNYSFTTYNQLLPKENEGKLLLKCWTNQMSLISNSGCQPRQRAFVPRGHICLNLQTCWKVANVIILIREMAERIPAPSTYRDVTESGLRSHDSWKSRQSLFASPLLAYRLRRSTTVRVSPAQC